jgi:Flp pilus assembly protein CpaB
MKPKTMILMVVAVGCGLGASYMTSKLLADRNVKPAEVQSVPVVVAKVRVAGWQPIKEPEKMFEVKMFPADVAPKRALGSLADLKDQRLNKPLEESKAVTQDDLLSKEQQTLTDNLQPGQRAVSIKVTTEGVVSGFVLPGARVDIICTTRSGEVSSKVVLQNMLVLAVDAQDQRNPEQKSIQAQTVTVAATSAEATRLALASEIGQLRLSLRNQGDTAMVNNVVVRPGDLNTPHNEGASETVEKPETPAPSNGAAAPPAVPLLPLVEKGPKVEEPKVEAPKQRRKHVMTIRNGMQHEKATFLEGDVEEDVASSGEAAATETTKDEAKEEKPAAKPKAADKPADKAADKAAGGPFSPKTTRTKRIQ